MNNKVSRNILIGLLAFLGIGALGGGVSLIISPGGSLLGLPLAALGSSPFNDFLIPGIILTLMLGIFPWLVIFALVDRTENKFCEHLNTFKDMHWAWTFSIYVGIMLIVWMQTEMMFENGVHWLHCFYMFLALLIIFVALLPGVRNFYKK